MSRRGIWLGGLAAGLGVVAGCRSASSPTATRPPAVARAPETPVAILSSAPSNAHLRNPLLGVPTRAGSGVSVSAAVIDLTTGRTWSVNPRLSAYTASLVKVPIFLAFARVSPPQRWTANVRQLAANMIEQSSNDAATTLWTRAGGAAALFGEIARLGMTHTVSAPTLLEPWDGVRTTAADQVRLLREVMKLRQPGSKSLLQLMQNLDSEQAWGVGYDLPLGWQVARKDGWVPVMDATDWTTSSIGVVTGNRVSAAVAIITTGARSYAAGRQVVNRVARAIDGQLLVEDG